AMWPRWSCWPRWVTGTINFPFTFLNLPCATRHDEGRSQPSQRRLGIAEPIGLHAHPVHQRQVQAAQLALFVGAARVIEHPPGGDGPSQPADEQHGELARIVPAT